MPKAVAIGWIISVLGTVLWVYGYFAARTPPFIDWHDRTPWWIANFVPNLQSEIGLVIYDEPTAQSADGLGPAIKRRASVEPQGLC